MNLGGGPVTVPATAGGIALSGPVSGAAVKSVSVQNIDGSKTVCIGKSSALTTTERIYDLLPGQSYFIDMDAGQTLYGIVASGTAVVLVGEVGRVGVF